MAIVGAFAVPHPPIILPQVGGAESRRIQKTSDAYRRIARMAADARPDVLVLTSPHAVMYEDYFCISSGAEASGDFGSFGVSSLKVRTAYDEEMVREIEAQASQAGIPAGTMGQKKPHLDHGTMIPLLFLQEQLPGIPIVRIGLSSLNSMAHYRLGQCIAEAAEKLGRRVVFIASGDLSHKLKDDGPYGFAPEGPVFDEMIQKVFRSGDFLQLFCQKPEFCQRAAECGLGSFQIMAGALDGIPVDAELLSYEGTFGVGYGVGAFIPKERDEEAGGAKDDDRCFAGKIIRLRREMISNTRRNEDQYVQLARRTVEQYVRTGHRLDKPQGLPEEMEKRAGVFVSLHKDGYLRGCIGTISATEDSIADEIISNGISAASRDPRFERVTEAELDSLVYSVDVLGPYEEIEDAGELDVRRYGVIVANGRRRGLLLPNLDGVDTPARQIEIAREKAGIKPGEPVELFRFEVVRHE